MKIGIVSAMSEELEYFKSLFGSFEISKNIYSTTLNNNEIYIYKTGIGKVNASIGIKHLIDNCSPDFIINIGACAAVVKKLQRKQIVISNDLKYVDVNVTAFGYKMGQVPGMPAIFESDKRLTVIISNILKDLNIDFSSVSFGTADFFLNDASLREKIVQDFQIDTFDMESAAYAQTCFVEGIPFICIRGISDNGHDDSDIQFDEILHDIAQITGNVLYEVIKKIDQ